MFLELAEVLDCPDCGASAGLVAFVDRAASRRVVEGRLGCPLCEIEVPIRRGTMRFDLSDAERRAAPALKAPAAPAWPAGEAAPDAALRLAALLGASDRAGMVVLLGPRLAAHAPAIARLGDRLEVLVWLPDAGGRSPPPAVAVEDLAAGVDPLMGAAPDRWPIRSGALHGIALAAPMALPLSEISRCARPGARLVVETPTPPDLDSLAASEFAEVASDRTVWVGERRQVWPETQPKDLPQPEKTL
ncbi:MAG: hypothetical protein OXI39_11395 [Gemmatimonadota bacterium]|uniref:hypothetical protein n=1 Tax=Candidatus Palauibacter scopulicola TaxID=3056741 RepID=UPI0023877A8D|nr:hypothetical protein [Candidatus Palauibacter scopulicola]MDE2663593.1 hypothetical protein [Candidatus Palauibacter scopulicola]